MNVKPHNKFYNFYLPIYLVVLAVLDCISFLIKKFTGVFFRCFLNQKTAVLRNVIQKIFRVILKFYDYLGSRSWHCEDGSYIHPNFKKLDGIFENFRELVQYFFKVGTKVAKSGCQPHLSQFLDLLDINGYISKSVKSCLS